MVDWIKFFDTVSEVVSLEGTFVEKRRAVVEAVRKAGEQAEMDFEEFLSWFDGELPP